MSTDHTRMMDKLRERCASSPKPVINQTPTDRKPLTWHRKSASIMETDDKTYQVEKRYAVTRPCSDTCGYIYMVFRMGNPPKMLGIYSEFEAAKQASELDREGLECATQATNSSTG